MYNYNYIALMVRTKITVHSCTAYYEEITIQKQEVDTESTVHITRTYHGTVISILCHSEQSVLSTTEGD
jgi:hypothetical protein